MPLRRIVRAACAIPLLFATANTGAMAQTIDEILNNDTPLEQVSDIKSQPLALLAKFPDAGVSMAKYVAELIMRQPSVVDAILSIMDTATQEQSAAIGAGIARSARALEAKQDGSANTLSGKVQRNKNVWLKTTYNAIGPNYAENAPLILPEPLQPQPLENVYVGTELPQEKGRVGPARTGENTGRIIGLNKGLPDGYGLLGRAGMIVAIIASDDKKNGAVSTSPTY